MAQIIRITSEALQATIRRLLPSQQGFGEDLQASNVILPIIDVTPTAEGSILRADLQVALDTATTNLQSNNSTDTVTSNAGFHILYPHVSNYAAAQGSVFYRIQTGLSTINIWGSPIAAGQVASFPPMVVFLDSGQTLEQGSSVTNAVLNTTHRPIADLQGNLTDPQGYQSQ